VRSRWAGLRASATTFVNEPSEELISSLESVLLVAAEPVDAGTLAAATGTSRERVQQGLEALSSSLSRGIRLQAHNGTYRLVTAPENVEVVQRFLGAVRPPALSRAALETLAIIAYRQPSTRAEIESVRGVDSDRSVRTLVMRGLIEEVGRRDTPGRPAEYGTTAAFLEYFGLLSLDDLPALPEEPGADLVVADLGLRSAAQDVGND
jgi:segregation and condensation protein B